MLRRVKALGEEPTQTESSPVTVILTNWKRPKNLRTIIDQLTTQTVKPVIFLWNNGKEFSHPAIRWKVDSSVNMACLPRWWMASCARTEFVCIMDDDLCFTDTAVLEDVIRIAREKKEFPIIGLFGVCFQSDKEYQHCKHINQPTQTNIVADMIKGRFMLIRTNMLQRIFLCPSPPRDALVADDIFVSGTLANGKAGAHLTLGGFGKRFIELPSHHALQKEPDHFEQRERARRRYFSI